MKKTLTVALLQQQGGEEGDQAFARTANLVRRAQQAGAELVVLQELHNGTYFCQTESTDAFNRAETIPGPTSDKLCALAQECGVVLVASLFERRSAGLYHNTAVVIEADGRIAGTYRKMHIPDDPGFYEKFYFTPGDLGFTPIKTSLGNLGVLVCWDQWYPEAARLMALAGADMLIYPTAIGWDPLDNVDEQHRQQQAWETIQRSHAIANGLPVLSVNRVGFEASPDPQASGITFWGNSFVAGPQGELLAKASSDEEEIVIVSIDLDRTEAVRRIWPFLRDRRIDAYGDLTKRFRD